MAESDESSPEHFVQKNRVHSYSDDSDTEDVVKLDIGIDVAAGPKNCVAASSASTSKEGPKREENSSFSFKHFLRYDMNNYQNLGARPKVYCDGRPITSISDLDLHQITMGKQTRIVPEFSSALPDFVQDHLVVEQAYLGKDNSNNYNLDLPNLPDFTPSRTGSVINRLNVDGNRENDNPSENNSNSSSSVLDLTNRPQGNLPLDLPISDVQPTTSRSCPSTAEVKILPDFLTDGPVRTQAADNQNNQSLDVDRLRLEIDLVRRELAQEKARANRLEMQLEEAQINHVEYTQNLNRTLVQAEDNLERCNRRVSSAEKTILKLRKEVKTLTTELNVLRKENYDLRGEASGGPSTSSACEQNYYENSRLAKELRSAADSAEFSLRQLLKGVDNLRLLASTVDDSHRIEEPNFEDFDDAS